MHKKVTVVMTSYKRFDLLQKTVSSFMEQNSYPIEKFIIIDDSVDSNIELQLKNHYTDKIDLIFNNPRLGQVKSIDKAYQLVDTPYLFHTEEDYLYQGNKNFIQDSIDILEERSDICQVHLKGIGDGNAGLINPDWVEPNSLTHTTTGVSYTLLKNPHCGNWCGFSWNAGLRRTDDYKKLFPNGYSFYLKDDAPECDRALFAEYYSNEEYQKAGFRGAILANSACIGIGHAFSTYRKKGDGGIL